MVEASSFRILGPILSGPIALCGLKCSNILHTPVSMMSMEFMDGKGDVLGNSLEAVGFHVETHSQIDDLVHQPSIWRLRSFFHFLSDIVHQRRPSCFI